MDAEEQKREERAAWSRMAQGFARHQPLMRKSTWPVTSRMMEVSRIGASHRVLDVACGAGDPTFAIAQRVGPTGSVLATDLARDMLDAAESEARSTGRTNIVFREVDAEALDVEAGTFDAVTMRFGLMFMPDPVACLRRCFAALKPGGRIAVACWAAPERNPWWTLSGDIARRHAGLPPIASGDPGPFRFGDPKALGTALAEAGFGDITIDEVAIRFGPYADANVWWQMTLDLRGAPVVMLDGLPAERRAHATREILSAARALEGPDALFVDGVSWVASGTR